MKLKPKQRMDRIGTRTFARTRTRIHRAGSVHWPERMLPQDGGKSCRRQGASPGQDSVGNGLSLL